MGYASRGETPGGVNGASSVLFDWPVFKKRQNFQFEMGETQASDTASPLLVAAIAVTPTSSLRLDASRTPDTPEPDRATRPAAAAAAAAALSGLMAPVKATRPPSLGRS